MSDLVIDRPSGLVNGAPFVVVGTKAVLLPADTTGIFDGDPNDAAAPIEITGAADGLLYLNTANELYQKQGTTWALLSRPGDTTKEAFTVAMAAAGTTPPPGVVINNQAISTALGPFNDIAALHTGRNFPDVIKHVITVTFPDGVTSLASLGDFARYNIEVTAQGSINPPTGYFDYKSASGLVRVGGTTTYAVTSSDGNGNVTFTGDPGFAADARRGEVMNVDSGPQAGATHMVRTHATTAFQVTGGFSPVLGATDVVEFLEPAATLELSISTPTIKAEMVPRRYPILRLNGIKLTSTEPNAIFRITGSTVQFLGGAQILLSVGVVGGNLLIDDCVVVPGNTFDGITINSGLVRGTGGGSPPLIYQGGTPAGTSGVRIIGPSGGDGGLGQGGSLFTLGAWCLDDFETSAVVLVQDGALFTPTSFGGAYPRHNATAPVAVRIENGGYMAVDNVGALDTDGQFEGSSDSVSLDGTELSWTTIDADTDSSAISQLGSRVIEQRSSF